MIFNEASLTAEQTDKRNYFVDYLDVQGENISVHNVTDCLRQHLYTDFISLSPLAIVMDH